MEIERCCAVRPLRKKSYALLDLVEQRVRSAMRSIASHDVDLVDFVAETPFNDFIRIKTAASSLKEGTALMMDLVHEFWC